MKTLSYDHRIVDGLEAVQFLVKVKEFIEDPGHLLVEARAPTAIEGRPR
jgi:pyruvate/2-oxoglutarate dehydrogenase complex dihydrolipoamide acyltransferase (E2) component